MFKSLRWRLLAWYIGILVLVVAGFGTVLYYQVRRARLDEVDAELLTAARSLDGTLRGFPRHVFEGDPDAPPPDRFPPDRPPDRPPPDWPPPRPEDRRRPPPPRDRHEPPPRSALVLPPDLAHRFGADADAAPYFVVWFDKGREFNKSPVPDGVPAPSYADLPELDLGQYRIRQRDNVREVILASREGSRVLVGRSIQHEREELTWFAGQLTLIGLAVLAVGVVGGWLVTGRAIRPLAAMSATAATISASNLGRRLDVAEVDSELGKLATILNQMFARLEAAFERQVQFTADASHELRTPLSVIHSHAELALTRPRTAEEYRDALETCLRASKRMKGLADGLLTLARADAGQLDVKQQSVDLGALVEENGELLQPLAAAAALRLLLKVQPVDVVGDAGRLSQVITNLLTNAMYYNRAGGDVTVTVEPGRGEAVLTIADTGCGIPEADRAHIFERFYRVDKARSRAVGGSGLGLAICKSIVEAHGGSIVCSSEVDRGTTFTVRLPRNGS